MQICRRCPEEGLKDFGEFSKNKKTKTGYEKECKKCRSERYRIEKISGALEVETKQQKKKTFLSLFMGNNDPLSVYF